MVHVAALLSTFFLSAELFVPFTRDPLSKHENEQLFKAQADACTKDF